MTVLPATGGKGGVVEIGLDNGAVLGIDGRGQGFVLRCLAGCLWVTRGDGRDYFIKAGKTMEFGRSDSVVVEAWGEARVLFVTPVGKEREGIVAPAWHLVSTP
nr:DUF2917 domain-containing protein [Geomobilimonas luticola]